VNTSPSVSVAEADRIEREMDLALVLLREAGDRGVVFIERRIGPQTTRHSLPRGRGFCESVDRLFSFGLTEITEPDRTYGPTEICISERVRLTELGRARAAEVVLPVDGLHEIA